ncbi:hypothetical protein ES705_06091 [subsurface metagenome]
MDLDIVNPYFRTREVKDTLSSKDIKVVAPEGEMTYANFSPDKRFNSKKEKK